MKQSTYYFPKALTLLFIYLKLTHQIEWHWLVVIWPLPVAIAMDFILKVIYKAWTKNAMNSPEGSTKRKTFDEALAELRAKKEL